MKTESTTTNAQEHTQRWRACRCDNAAGLRSFVVCAGSDVVAEVPVQDVYGPGAHRDEDYARNLARLLVHAPMLAAELEDMQKFCPVSVQDRIRELLGAAG